MKTFPLLLSVKMVCSEINWLVNLTVLEESFVISNDMCWLLFDILISDKIKDAKIIFVVGEYNSHTYIMLFYFAPSQHIEKLLCFGTPIYLAFLSQVGLALERAPSVRKWLPSMATLTCHQEICSVLRCLLAQIGGSSSRPSCRRESLCPW